MNKTIIGQIEQKIYNIIHLLLKKAIPPDIVLKDVKDIDLEFIKRIKSEFGIGGIILDVDDTIRKSMMHIPDCNKEWINFMKKEFRVTILSNGYDGKIKIFANENDIPYIYFAKKPLKKNFLSACKDMGLYPENVLVIGDDIMCDIYGGRKSGMFTAIVDSINRAKEFDR